MNVTDLVARVSSQLEQARRTVTELEQIRDCLIVYSAENALIAKQDHIPGIGSMNRSKAYMAALRMGCMRVMPSYEDSNGEIWTLFTSEKYIRKAQNLGIGILGNRLVLLNIAEHAKVKRALRKERTKS